MSGVVDRLELALNAELIKRLLVKYFVDIGVENFDKPAYPPLLQGITEHIPQLASKIELEPFADEIDPQTGYARIGWNLFVLGNQRMFLGETDHYDLSELAKQIESGTYYFDLEDAHVRRSRTVREVITWISKALGRSLAGIARPETTEVTPQPSNLMAGQNAQSMFERPKTIRPEGTAQF